MRRSTIRKKVRAIVLYISVIALIITGAVGIYGMLRIQEDSESALVSQMENNLEALIDAKSDFADSELGRDAGHVSNFSQYIHELYASPQNYVSREVLPCRRETEGRIVMQRTMLNEGVDVNSVMNEIKLFGNLEQLWAPVMEAYNGTLLVMYAATESGVMIAYGLNSLEALPEEGHTEAYFDFHSRPWYKEAKEKGRVIFTDIYEDGYGRGLTITCAAPFYNAEGKFAGVVGMDVLIGNLYNAIVDVDLGSESYTFLADKTGKIITPGGGAQMISDITTSLAYKIMSGKPGVSLSNSRVYYAYTPIKSTGWILCSSIPERVIIAPVRDVNKRVIFTILSFIGAFVIIVAFAVIVARKLSHKLTEPIIALEDDVKKIAGGNLDYRAEIRTNDEIGDLAKSFNDMAASLKEYVKNLAAVTAEKERIGAELNIATQIQADMLPRIFPPFPDRKEFDIYATMNPAKEVGGDFYDFFLIDSNHLALVMADVSGKGVPAALFMVIAKTLIKNRAQMGGTPSEILADVNNQLCEGNEAELFVTVWLGILEISTGHVTASNAGHEYPAIYRPGEGYTLFRTKQSPAVATMEGLRFKPSEFTLNPGDNLYLYTDGVAEATNSSEELYGTERMLDSLNHTDGMTVEEILRTMKKSVDDFTGEAPQFDDITMLSLKYYGVKG